MDFKKPVLLIAMLCYLFTSEGYSQTIDYGDPLANSSGAVGIMFFGRQPSARVEAMGKNFMAFDGSISSAFYNPAALSFNKGISFSYSNSGPYYGLNSAEYNFVGGMYTSEKYGTLGFSFYQYNPHFEPFSSGLTAFKQKVTLYTVSYATELVPSLHLGINVNIFTLWNKFPPREEILLEIGAINRKGIFPDIGILKSFNFSRANMEHVINIGSSLFNATKEDFKQTTNIRGTRDKELPVTLRIGASYQSSLNRRTGHYKLNTLSWFLAAEYQEILNSKYRSGLKFGGEITGFEILKLRMGYYREILPFSDNCSNCKKYLSDFTYGAGIFLPL